MDSSRCQSSSPSDDGRGKTCQAVAAASRTRMVQEDAARQGRSPPMPTSSRLNHDGFRVLDFTQNVAGRWPGRCWSTWGLKSSEWRRPAVKRPVRSPQCYPDARPWPLLSAQQSWQGVSDGGPNRRQAKQILRLADTADVVLEAFRLTPWKSGPRPDDLRSRSPN